MNGLLAPGLLSKLFLQGLKPQFFFFLETKGMAMGTKYQTKFPLCAMELELIRFTNSPIRKGPNIAMDNLENSKSE